MNEEEKNLEQFLRCGTPDDIKELYLAVKDIADDSDFGCLDNDLVIVDTEATGLSFTKDELIQIAAARVEQGKIIDWYVTFVDPGQEISQDITDLTHISNDDVFGAPSPNEALVGLVKFAKNSKMLAHNVGFDKTFLTKHVEGYPLLDNIWIDSLDLVRICFPRLTSHRLIDLSRAFSIIESTHRADDDVATTAIVYRLCLAQISCMDIDLINLIANYADIDMWSSSYVFKKMYDLLSGQSSACSASDYMDSQNSDSDQDAFLLQEGENSSTGKNNKVNAFTVLKKFRKSRIKKIRTKTKHDVEIPSDGLEDEKSAFSMLNPNSLQFSDPSSVKNDFTSEGSLGKIYENYEMRPQQAIMAKNIVDAFKDSNNLVIEAGTGVGKSMAYLLPSIRLAIENEIIVGVATKTNALLDQLVYSELPAIKKIIPDLEYSALKGSKHYICLRKLSNLANGSAKIIDFKSEQFCNAASVASLLSFVQQTAYDDCDGLKINGRALFAKQYTCASHECLKHKCPFFNNGCFVHGARKMAQNSDIVVTNHTMLFCDIKSDNALLPPIKYWIIDEAHNMEKEARAAFKNTISAAKLLEFSKGLEKDDTKLNVFCRSKNFIDINSLSAKSEANLSQNAAREGRSAIYGLYNKCIDRGHDLASSSSIFANNLNKLLKFATKQKNGYEFCDIWIDSNIRESEAFNELYDFAKQFVTDAQSLLTCANNLVCYMDDYKDCAIAKQEILVFIYDVKEILDACDLIFFRESPSYVYSAHLNTKKTVVFDFISAELINVGDSLRQNLYSQCMSCIMTSATLTIANSFDSFYNAVGLSKSDTKSIILKSSFNYDKNMTIYVASDMPDPNSSDYIDYLNDFLIKLHIAGRGSILTLFTNRREMNLAYNEVEPAVKSRGLDIICQKWKTSPKMIRDQFINDEHISLFALKSFWEGFDVGGDALKGVVIPKLPFSLPTDPLYKQRKAMEKSAWFKYILPESIMAVKQAVGRLIRNSKDSGYIVFADSRLVSTNKTYGPLFLKSMPSKNIKILPMRDIVKEISDEYNV